MAWCEACSKSFPDTDLDGTPPGTCPDCSGRLAEPPPTPWHFKLMVLALTVYLGWRAWQGIGWLLAHL